MVIDRALAERLERHPAGTPSSLRAWLADHPNEDLRVQEIAGAWIAEPLPGASWGGGGNGLGFQGPLADEDFQAVLASADRVGPRFRVVVCPYADASVARRFVSAGFVVDGFRTVLVRSLRDLETLAPTAKLAPEVEIRRVRGAADLDRFTDVVSRGFNTGAPPREVDQRMTHIVHSSPGATLYLALVNGTPAGGGRIDCAGGVGFMLGGSVLPEYRRRGLHQALILARMRAAAENGCDIVTIGSLAGGATERNAQRLGYEVAYSAMELLRGPI